MFYLSVRAENCAHVSYCLIKINSLFFNLLCALTLFRKAGIHSVSDFVVNKSKTGATKTEKEKEKVARSPDQLDPLV